MTKLKQIWNIICDKTKYPQQQLTDKQKTVIEFIDQSLATMHNNKPVSGALDVYAVSIPFMKTMLDADKIAHNLQFEIGDAYIPRCIAFQVDEYGNWIIYYGLYKLNNECDDITRRLFIDALTRTNNARLI